MSSYTIELSLVCAFYRYSVLCLQSAGVNMNLGALLHLLSRYDEAEVYYHEALELQPGDQLTTDNLKKLKQAMQRHTQ